MFDGDVPVFQQVSIALHLAATPRVVHPLNVEDRRIPLVVGITGHTDMRDEHLDVLLRRVTRILRDLKTKYVDTPLVVLSALAEGADRVGARAALKLRKQYSGDVRLIVPLPMKLDMYVRDFIGDTDSVREFLELVNEADYWFPRPLLDGNTEVNVQSSTAHRNRQYEDLGKYIARHCQVLIALWDGQDEGGTGGTREVVRFKLEGVRAFSGRGGEGDPYAPHVSVLEPAESGPVYHVVTPRTGRPDVDRALSVHEHYPSQFFTSESEARNHYETIFRHINTFNRQSSANAPLRTAIRDSKRNLLPEEIQRQLTVNDRAVLERYGVTDALALGFADKMRRVQRGVHLWALLGLVLFEAFAHGSEFIPLARSTAQSISLFLALAAFSWAGLRYFRGRHNQDLYQDYRALAEGLRVGLFWRLADIDASVANYYLGKHRTELDWIRNALRNWNIPWAPPEHNRRLDLALKYWVKHQHEFFRFREFSETSRHNSPWVRRFLCVAVGVAFAYWIADLPQVADEYPRLFRGPEWTIAVLAIATMLAITSILFRHQILRILKPVPDAAAVVDPVAIVMTLIVAGIGYALLAGFNALTAHHDGWHAVVAVVIALLLAAAGLKHHYGEQMAYREHAKMYRHMRDLFGRALRQMEGARSEQEQQEILHDLGIFALEENGDWVMLHREHPLEVPFG